MRYPAGFFVSAVFCVASAMAQGGGEARPCVVPEELRALVAAYAGHLALDGTNGVIWPDGTRMMFDDGIPKGDFEDLLNRASLKDQMAQAYPAFRREAKPPARDFDPGRARHEAFFKKMYGESERVIRERLRRVPWLGEGGAVLQVTTVNGVDTLIERVSKELELMDPALRRFLLPVGGGFNWRPIAGTHRLSPHSYGIAVDLNPTKGSYWRWGGGGEALPWEIVEVFERHGFIWGGRWAHVDSFHFEYRPELLMLAAWRNAAQSQAATIRDAEDQVPVGGRN